MRVSGIILAGGHSRRLGTDKAFLTLGGQTLIERVLRTMRGLVDDVVIVTNDRPRYAHLGARMIGDVYPGKASLGGIYSGLLAAQHDRGLVVGCDMPFLNAGLLRYMLSLAETNHVVIPRYGTYLEPLHAIYTKRCLEGMRQLIERDELRISKVFCDAPTRYVSGEEIALFDPDKLSFFNINTPEDLDQARAWVALEDRSSDLEAVRLVEDEVE